MNWRWTRRRPRSETQPAPVPVVEALPSDEGSQKQWVDFMETKYLAILNAQSDMQIVLHELHEHVQCDHGGDIEDCDVWCWPRTVRRTIGALESDERWVFTMVLIKEWFWRQAVMAAGVPIDDGPDDSQDSTTASG